MILHYPVLDASKLSRDKGKYRHNADASKALLSSHGWGLSDEAHDSMLGATGSTIGGAAGLSDGANSGALGGGPLGGGPLGESAFE